MSEHRVRGIVRLGGQFPTEKGFVLCPLAHSLSSLPSFPTRKKGEREKGRKGSGTGKRGKEKGREGENIKQIKPCILNSYENRKDSGVRVV